MWAGDLAFSSSACFVEMCWRLLQRGDLLLSAGREPAGGKRFSPAVPTRAVAGVDMPAALARCTLLHAGRF